MKDKRRGYEGVTPEVFEELKAKLSEEGGLVTGGQKGSVTIAVRGLDFSLGYEWDGEDQIAIVCNKKPFVVSYGRLWRELDGMLAPLGIGPSGKG